MAVHTLEVCRWIAAVGVAGLMAHVWLRYGLVRAELAQLRRDVLGGQLPAAADLDEIDCRLARVEDWVSDRERARRQYEAGTVLHSARREDRSCRGTGR